MSTSHTRIPESLDEAVDIIVSSTSPEVIEKYKTLTEKEILSGSHHSLGMSIRNNWHLWWEESHTYDEWPKEKPKLVEEFNALGIYHADDMSGIILSSAIRRIQDKPRKLNEEVAKYKKFWAKQGFEDGIFKPKK